MKNKIKDFLKSPRGISIILVIGIILGFILNTLHEVEIIAGQEAQSNNARLVTESLDSNVWLDSTIRELEWWTERSVRVEDIKDINSLISQRLGKQWDNACTSGNNVRIILLKEKNKKDLLSAATEDGYGLDSSAVVIGSDFSYLFDPTDKKYKKITPTKGCQLIIAIGYTLFNKEELAELTVRVIKSYFPRKYPRWYYFKNSVPKQKKQYSKREASQLAIAY
jgi:hypothetical protein